MQIGPLVQDAIDLARSRHHLSAEALDWSRDGRPAEQLTVMGDRDELFTALGNVLDNAVKYSPKDPWIRVAVVTPDLEHVEIRVQDNGVGIPRGELKRVFKRFYRVLTPGASQVKGSGLGLFIVRAIARRHGGDAYAESDGSGHGSTITIRVAEELAVREILLVEDEEHLARGLKFNLEAEGYPTRVVGDGETALELLLQEHSEFDLLVLDVMLPGKDGFAVATELRKASNYIPLLMLTARGSPEDVLKGFASGADDYLPKPFDLAILLARIRGLLRRRDWGRTLLTDPPADARVAEPSEAGSLREFDVYVFRR